MGEATEWLSTTEVSDRLGITPRGLYQLIDDNWLPGYRFGRVIRLKDSDVQEFIDELGNDGLGGLPGRV